jgi:hypothetical protein
MFYDAETKEKMQKMLPRDHTVGELAVEVGFQDKENWIQYYTFRLLTRAAGTISAVHKHILAQAD